MAEELTVKLEETPEFIGKKISEYKDIKRTLDSLSDKIQQLYQQEKYFNDLFKDIKLTQEAMKSFFDGIENENLQRIDKELGALSHEYKERIVFLKENIRHKEFSMEDLATLSSEVLMFLKAKTEAVNGIGSQQKNEFQKAAIEINDKFNILDRLVNALTKKIDSSNENKLKEFLDDERTQIQKIKAETPSELVEIKNKDKNSIKGLYSRIINEASFHLEKIRHFAIKNKLLSKDEIMTLEALYEVQAKEFEFNEVATILKDKLMLDEEKIQSLLFDLSKKGFITLKIFFE